MQHSLLNDEGGQTVTLFVHVELMSAAVLLGTASTKQAVVAKMRELNVQLDNLCQVRHTGGAEAAGDCLGRLLLPI